MPFTHIALAGATPSADGWSTGTHIARSLLKRGVKLTVLARKASQNDPEKKKQAEEYVAKGAKVAWVDYSDENELVRALKGVDCVVSTLAVKDPSGSFDLQMLEAGYLNRAFFPCSSYRRCRTGAYQGCG